MQHVARTTTVLVDDSEYQLRKMTPAVGSYIWQLLMAACFKARQSMVVGTDEEQATSQETLSTPAEKLRGLCGIAFMHLDFKDHEFIQTNCMRTVSKLEDLAGTITPMPIMMDNGSWANVDVADSLLLITKLTVEALVFNLSSFLSESGSAGQRL